MIDEYYTFKIFGYHSYDWKPQSNKRVVAICDNCYLYRTLKISDYSDMCRACTNKYNSVKMSNTHLSPKEPLPYGWQSKLSDITNNKECASYLGCIAETILSNVYNNVSIMPYGNHGYDFICSRDMKIDVKSSSTGDKRGYWYFNIRKNQIADYFLCVAFNNRSDLRHPAHLWLIPAHIVNHSTSLYIYNNTINRWSKYELSLDKVIMCCDSLR